MRPKTIRGWNIDEGAVPGHWASLTLALLGCGFFFPVLHQSRLLTSNKLLQGSPGSRLRRTLSHPVWLACSYLPKWAPQKKEEAPSWFSHCKSGWAESACCTFSNSFPPPISSRSLCFFFLPPSLSLFSLSLLWISAHCATRKCTSRACQLHHGAFHLERPEPSVYQWNQPGI